MHNLILRRPVSGGWPAKIACVFRYTLGTSSYWHDDAAKSLVRHGAHPVFRFHYPVGVTPARNGRRLSPNAVVLLPLLNEYCKLRYKCQLCWEFSSESAGMIWNCA